MKCDRRVQNPADNVISSGTWAGNHKGIAAFAGVELQLIHDACHDMPEPNLFSTR